MIGKVGFAPNTVSFGVVTGNEREKDLLAERCPVAYQRMEKAPEVFNVVTDPMHIYPPHIEMTREGVRYMNVCRKDFNYVKDQTRGCNEENTQWNPVTVNAWLDGYRIKPLQTAIPEPRPVKSGSEAA